MRTKNTCEQEDNIVSLEDVIGNHLITTLKLSRGSSDLVLVKFITEHLKTGSGDVILCSPSVEQTKSNYNNIKASGNTETTDGYIFNGKNCNVYMLTCNSRTNIVGHTAEAALIIDDAQDMDEELFRRELLPMVAFMNAPIVRIEILENKEN